MNFSQWTTEREARTWIRVGHMAFCLNDVECFWAGLPGETIVRFRDGSEVMVPRPFSVVLEAAGLVEEGGAR